MREVWKSRRLFNLKETIVVVVLVALLCPPVIIMGICLTGSGLGSMKIPSAQASDVEAGQPVVSDAVLNEAVMNAEAVNEAVYDDSVLRALAHMGLTPKHIELWSSEHPHTTLKGLNSMTTERQRKVANIATFIRKVNKNISPKTAWREACAFVYYSGKYGVPTNLAVGIAKMESRFNPSAASQGGALGVMQVVWKIHYGMLSKKGIASTRDHMFDPERGVAAGILLIARYVNVYGSVQKAVTKYYGGIARSYKSKIDKNIAMLESHSSGTGF